MNAFELNLPLLLLAVKRNIADWDNGSSPKMFAFFDNVVIAFTLIMHFLIGVIAPSLNNGICALVQIADKTAIDLIQRRVRCGFIEGSFHGC